MRKLIILLFLSLSLTYCSEKQVVTQAQLDELAIKNYLTEHDLEATKSESGLYYIISTSGTGGKPATNAKIRVGYVGRLLNGSIFDQSTDFTGNLNEMIQGWKEGIPLIGTGGKIKLIIPSALGYGSNSYPRIPANSVLVFDVTLISFTNP